MRILYCFLVYTSLGQMAVADTVYDYQGNSTKGYGEEVNADTLKLRRLFGLPPGMDQRPAREKKNGWLGISMRQPDQSHAGLLKDARAIEVVIVVPASPADEAGLRAGDLIVGFNGESVSESDALMTFRQSIIDMRSGEILKLKIMREKSQLEVEATIKPQLRTQPVLKSHPGLDMHIGANESSLLMDALGKEKLADEYARLLDIIRDETEKVVSVAVHMDGYNPFRLQELNYVLHHPLDLPVIARKRITDRLGAAFNNKRHDIEGLLSTAMDGLDMEAVLPPLKSGKPPADFTEYIERLLKVMHHANSERNAVLSVLNAEELDFLYESAAELLKEESGAIKKELTNAEKREEDIYWLKFFRVVLKLDIKRLLQASAGVVRALDTEVLVTLNRNSGKLEHYPDDWQVREEENLTIIDTREGSVLIGGIADNTYTEDAMLIIDFGGNDRYLNQVGGGTRVNPFSAGIDLSGDDIYIASEDFAQGAALLGGGFLIDLEGNDQYLAENYSQGAGILGVGILVDDSGRDRYHAIAASQGAGALGVGLLAEGDGNDVYYGNRFVQGFGSVKGYGAVIEAGGNDNYFAGSMYEDTRAPGKSYQSMSQGFGYGIRPWESLAGASGGIGIIAEAEGNDTYVADYFAQGSSYWFALGILDDRKGDDRYISGRYSQGAGIHLSAGVLLDGEGDDSYLADFGVAQGCGHDYGVGFLLDNGGNDRYMAGTIAQGVGNDNGIGVLSDNGGNDEYFLRNLGQGYGNLESTRGVGSFGLLFDTGGGSDIFSLGGKNNALKYKNRWGIFADTD